MERADTQAGLRPGERLGGRYRVEAPLSAGAMGEVYRARDDDGTEVALKRLLDTRHAARFEIEALLLTQLDHPRVVSVIDHFDEGGSSFIVMELVRGGDLGDLLRDEGDPGLPREQVVEHGRDACEALQYLHDQHVVHRDVKPDNLIIGPGGVVLVDFGVARHVTAGEPSTEAIGTPGFMAPEVLTEGAASPTSDIFGLAATIWTLLVGRPPRYASPEDLAEGLPADARDLGDALIAGLELSPERRTASAAEFAEALGAPLGEPRGVSLTRSESGPGDRQLLEAIVEQAALEFDCAAASVAVVDPETRGLVYQAAWGAGAEKVLGRRLEPGEGIAGAVMRTGEPELIAECRSDPRFAAGFAESTEYVPHTMLVVPLEIGGLVSGVMALLDRRDGLPFTDGDARRAGEFADSALEVVQRTGRPEQDA